MQSARGVSCTYNIHGNTLVRQIQTRGYCIGRDIFVPSKTGSPRQNNQGFGARYLYRNMSYSYQTRRRSMLNVLVTSHIGPVLIGHHSRLRGSPEHLQNSAYIQSHPQGYKPGIKRTALRKTLAKPIHFILVVFWLRLSAHLCVLLSSNAAPLNLPN